MERDDVLRKLIEILKEFQALEGDEVDDIDELTKPVTGLRNFDSLTGVEATVVCFERFEIPESKRGKVQSLFVAEDRNGHPYALKVGEIVERIMALKK